MRMPQKQSRDFMQNKQLSSLTQQRATPKGSLLLGYIAGRPLVLSVRDRSMGLIVVGTVGTGKTTSMAEWIRQDAVARASFTLIDPMGPLYKDTLAFLCYLKSIGIPVPEVILFNPSEGLITPYNPFARRELGDLGVAVDRRVTAILRAWGQSNSDNTPRLERWLRCLITVLIECGLTLVEAGFLLDRKNAALREHFAAGLRNPMIRAKFEALSNYKPSEFNEQVESVENRLMRFLTSDTMRRMMGTGRKPLDFSQILDGRILLANLQTSDFLSPEQARLIGTMIVTEEYETALQRPTGARPHGIYIDEAPKFLTPEIA